MGMEFPEVLRRRRMVRNYADEPVDPAAVERIVDAARRAPTAGFSQGQDLIVITDPATRAAVAELAGEAEYVAEGFDPWISHAPVHIVVCATPAAYLRRYAEPDKGGPDGPLATEEGWEIPYWWVDAGAVMMLLLLAAVDEGLAAGFLGVHAIPGLRRLLGIPHETFPIGVVTVGHPAPDRRSGSLARGRRPFDEQVHRGRW